MEKRRLNVICLWSGGKDSCLALYRAKNQNYKITCLLNFISKNTNISSSHGLYSELLSYQASLMNIPIIQPKVEKGRYAEVFKDVINDLKKSYQIEGIVFGDIYLEVHKKWADEICNKLKIKQIMPLWKYNTLELLLEFINNGFEAIIVSTKKEILGRQWLGCKINKEFVKKLSNLSQKIDPCGEEGEFHTLVTNAPIFKQPLQLIKTKEVLRNERWYLEVINWQ
jgi:uncharacterized protein (TIGR00290 family)